MLQISEEFTFLEKKRFEMIQNGQKLTEISEIGPVRSFAIAIGSSNNSSLQCYSVLSTIEQVLRKMSLKVIAS